MLEMQVKIKDGRLEFPRDFPAYAGGNKYVSNVPGSTMFMPVTEVTQHINGLFYVLAQEPGRRPVFLDDFNNWAALRLRAVGEIEVPQQGDPHPARLLCEGRTDYEAMLLLQNLALVAQSMGLGGWIHAAFENTILLGGYPNIGPGLGFRFERPKKRLIPGPGVDTEPGGSRRGAAVICATVFQGHRRRHRRDPRGEIRTVRSLLEGGHSGAEHEA